MRRKQADAGRAEGTGCPWDAVPWLLVALVASVTFASAVDNGLVADLAASARRVAHGHVWLLLTSGLLAEQPRLASVASFAILAALTFAVCGSRAALIVALAGHVGSALLTYAAIGAARLVDPGAFGAAWRTLDYGVSAISAAWLGAIAMAGWRARGGSWPGRVAIAFSCSAIALFAYMLRPGLSFLASEHVTAFAIGGALSLRLTARPVLTANIVRRAQALDGAIRRATGRRSWLRKVDPVAAAAVLITVVLVGGSTMPSALGALGRAVLHNRVRERCVVVASVRRGHVAFSCEALRNTVSLEQFPNRLSVLRAPVRVVP